MRVLLLPTLVLFSAPAWATLVIFVPATDGYVLCGDKRITDARTGKTFAAETKIHRVSQSLVWSAVGNTAFYSNATGVRFWDTSSVITTVVASKNEWSQPALADAIEQELVELFNSAFEQQRISNQPNTSLFQTLIYSPTPSGLRLLMTTFFFVPPNILRPYRTERILEHVSGWGSGGAFLAELWRGTNRALSDIRSNVRIMDFLNEKPRVSSTEAITITKEVIRLASEREHLFPNVHVSPTSDCLIMPLMTEE